MDDEPGVQEQPGLRSIKKNKKELIYNVQNGYNNVLIFNIKKLALPLKIAFF